MNLKFGKSKTISLDGKVKELETEVETLMKENAELRDTIKNISFNDNGDVFTINMKSDFFFGKVKIQDAIALLKNMNGSDTIINFGYEVVK